MKFRLDYIINKHVILNLFQDLINVKFILVFVFLFIFCPSVIALEIVYPKKNPVAINANSTFFIGSVNKGETLKINGADVSVSPFGAFAQTVPLNIGKNEFVITSGIDNMSFTIERPQPQTAASTPPVLIEYPVMTFYVVKDGTPLRMTPVDGGINRMSHLSEDTQLFINGEKGNFYRVYLNSKLTGWILKSDVEQRQIKAENAENTNLPIKLKEFKIKEEKEFCLYEFELEGKVPFTIKEENGLTVQIFNVEGQIDSTYYLNIPSQKLMGYDAYYDKDKFVLKVRKTPETCSEKPLHNIKIVVDAGHGGKEVGAIGCCGDKEKDINLAISKGLKKELDSRGAHVEMTRADDSTVSLQDRVKFAREKDATILVSIHANALPDGQDPIKNRGTSVYYYHNQAKPLAESILSEMTTQLGTNNDKVRQGSLALVRPTSSVSVLIEVAYMINPDDYALLTDKDFQQKCAKAIADGIEKYFLN